MRRFEQQPAHHLSVREVGIERPFSPRARDKEWISDCHAATGLGRVRTGLISIENEGDVVEVAVAPVLASFGGADDGVARVRKCAEACLFGESSQQPMCPHDRHMRRCTHQLPLTGIPRSQQCFRAAP